VADIEITATSVVGATVAAIQSAAAL